jgi:hypothetical protein
MRPLVLGLFLMAPIAFAQNSLAGHWVGTVKPDRDKLMAKATVPEHRKLLDYAIGRLEKAQATLDLNPNGTFKYLFFDGYNADRQQIAGTWTSTSTDVVIKVKAFTQKLPLTDGGKHITTNYNDIVGVPIIFTQDPGRSSTRSKS